MHCSTSSRCAALHLPAEGLPCPLLLHPPLHAARHTLHAARFCPLTSAHSAAAQPLAYRYFATFNVTAAVEPLLAANASDPPGLAAAAAGAAKEEEEEQVLARLSVYKLIKRAERAGVPATAIEAAAEGKDDQLGLAKLVLAAAAAARAQSSLMAPLTTQLPVGMKRGTAAVEEDLAAAGPPPQSWPQPSHSPPEASVRPIARLSLPPAASMESRPADPDRPARGGHRRNLCRRDWCGAVAARHTAGLLCLSLRALL